MKISYARSAYRYLRGLGGCNGRIGVNVTKEIESTTSMCLDSAESFNVENLIFEMFAGFYLSHLFMANRQSFKQSMSMILSHNTLTS